MYTIRFFLSTYLTQQHSVLLSTRIWILLILLFCCSSLQVSAQTSVFGPQTYTTGQGTSSTVTKTFTVVKPEGNFDLIVESTARQNERALPINVIIHLNGIEIVGRGDGNKLRIVKTVALRPENTISVQLNGVSATSIVLTISPSPEFTLFTNPKEPLLLRAKYADGRKVDYFGKKTLAGTARSLDSILVTSPEGDVSTYIFDSRSRVSEIRTSQGFTLSFEWLSDTAAKMTATSADGVGRVT